MSGEKTEKATPKRRRDERKKGNIFVSKDVVTVFTLLGSFYILKFTFYRGYEELKGFFLKYFGYIGGLEYLNQDRIMDMAREGALVAVRIMVPLMGAVMLISIAATVFQTKPLFITEPLKPKFSKMNPINGMKRLFSLNSIVGVVKNLLKFIVLFYLMYRFIEGEIQQMPRLLSMNVMNSAVYMFQALFNMAIKIIVAFAILSVFDYAYQKWDYERKIKMSKQEIKEEFKQLEGDPKVKGKIKQIQRQRAMSRMMQQVPDADVVIKNPTHFAVALRYDADKDNAPVLLAKGQDELALRIIKVAEENKVTVVENRPLARAIFATTELNQELPREFYGAVASILAHIYKMNKKI